jgi:hypothetical protein
VQFLIDELAPENRRCFLRWRQVAADQVLIDLGTLGVEVVKSSPGNEHANHALTAMLRCIIPHCVAAQIRPTLKHHVWAKDLPIRSARALLPIGGERASSLKWRTDMKKLLVSSALALSFFCLEASVSAKAQEFFFPNAYSRPAEEVDGLDVGTRNAADIFAPTTTTASQTPAVAAQQRQFAHVTR